MARHELTKEERAKNDFRKRPKDAGRRKNLICSAADELLSAADIAAIYSHLLLLTPKELEDIAKDKSGRCYVQVGAARGLLKDGARGETKTLDKVIDRIIGKPKTQTDITTNGKDIQCEPLTIEIIDRREQVDREG